MTRKFLSTIFILTSFLIFSCDEAGSPPSDNAGFEPVEIAYAKAFSLYSSVEGMKASVHLPGNADQPVQEIYIGMERSGNFTGKVYLSSHPKRIILLSTTYLSYFLALGALNKVVAISNSELVYSPEIRKSVEDGNIADVGNDQALNYEKIIELKPDLIFIYDFGPATSAVIRKLESFKLKVVRVNEFMETSPLGKTEWIRFFGALLDEESVADSLFHKVEVEYNSLLSFDTLFSTRPTVFTGLPWKGEWYQPGGRSFQAAYFKDAGAEYLWSDNEDVSGINVDREVVFDRALKADFWFYPSNALFLSEILAQDERYGHFSSFQAGNVYNNNLRLNENMGNDYWESGLLNPHLILKDMMAIFHPEVFPDHQFEYFRKLDHP